MKRLLLALFVSAAMLQAQSDTPNQSAFGGGQGVSGEVLAFAVQPDGKVVIGGRFNAVNGIPRNNIARLNVDGTLDRSFADNIESGVNGQINALAAPPAGGIIVGGQFSQLGGYQTVNLGRYNVDGTPDKSFGGITQGEVGANGIVFALTVQPDGKVVVGGNFATVFGQPRRSLARLNTDGTLDGPVAPQNAVSGVIRAVAPVGETSFVAGGSFTMQAQNARNLLKGPVAAGQ